MLAFLRKSFLPSSRPSQKRSACPLLENLEERLLLYSTYGGTWTYGSRITFSFMPDGTNVGGTPSALFSTMKNANIPTATWEAAIENAAAVWEAVANINLALVSDNGSPEGCSGNQQDDPRFGDIRIGAVPLAPNVLAETYKPPPSNGGTDAGDIFLNSTLNSTEAWNIYGSNTWTINGSVTDIDLETVAIHEFGHALGLGESSIGAACMYGTYTGVKQSLNADDIAGIQSLTFVNIAGNLVSGAPQPVDQFNTNGQSNGMFWQSANLNSYIQSNGQVAIGSLDLTSSGQSEWFSVTVPSSNSGTLVATVQSSNLSSLSPQVTVSTTGLVSLGSASPLSPQVTVSTTGSVLSLGPASPTSFGATVSVTIQGVKAGQTYLIQVNGIPQVGNAAGSIGGFGLELNFGSQSQSPIAPPNTVVPQEPDQGGGVGYLKIGNVTGWGNILLGNLPNLAALVAGTNIAQSQLIGGVVGLTATGSPNPGTLDSGSTPSIFQAAVDFLIMNSTEQDGLSSFTRSNAPNGFPAWYLNR